MSVLKDTFNQGGYREVIAQIKQRKTRNLDEEMLKNTLRLRNQLKSIDTVAAILGISGISIEYYLVILT